MVALNRFLCYFTGVYVHGRYLNGSPKQVSVLFLWCVGAWKILRW